MTSITLITPVIKNSKTVVKLRRFPVVEGSFLGKNASRAGGVSVEGLGKIKRSFRKGKQRRVFRPYPLPKLHLVSEFLGSLRVGARWKEVGVDG